MIPWRAHDALFKLTVIGLGLAAFSALLAIATVAIRFSSSGQLLIIQRPAQATTVPPAGSDAIAVAVVDQLCLADADCTVVPTRCDSCGCGQSVNRLSEPTYLEQRQTLCADYHGIRCQSACPTPYPRCLDGRCTLSDLPPVPPAEP